MPKDKPPHMIDAPPLPEGFVGTFREVYNDLQDVTGGMGDPLPGGKTRAAILPGGNGPEGETLPTRKQRKKLEAASTITLMQESFIAAYVATRDKLRAAQEAGYAPSVAPVMANRLLNPTFYPLVVARIRELLKKQQEFSVLDAAGVLKYVHTVMQFSPADWFIPGDDGGWLMDMDDVRVLPNEIKSIIEHIEMKTIEHVDGSKTNKMWVKFVSKTHALAIAARYQLGELNKETTQVQQIDWSKLFGRGPVTVTQTQTTVSVGEGSSSKSSSKALSTSKSVVDAHILPPEIQPEDDPIEAQIIKVEALATTQPQSENTMSVTDRVKALSKKGKK